MDELQCVLCATLHENAWYSSQSAVFTAGAYERDRNARKNKDRAACFSLGHSNAAIRVPDSGRSFVHVSGISAARLMNRPIASTCTRNSTSSRDEKIRRKDRTAEQTNENVWSADHYQTIYVHSYAKCFSASRSRWPFLSLRSFA